jgi:hypothetical protein
MASAWAVIKDLFLVKFVNDDDARTTGAAKEATCTRPSPIAACTYGIGICRRRTRD